MSQAVIPQLRITNAEDSQRFYVDGLGFKVDWTHQFEPGFPLFLQLTRGAPVGEAPADMPWGHCEFVLSDPDGNRLRFASDNAKAAAPGR